MRNWHLHWPFVLISGGAAIAVAAVAFALNEARGRRVLRKWAELNGFRLLNSRVHYVGRGPFTTSLRGETVFRVTVESADGVIKDGWVACNIQTLGPLWRVRVQWDPQRGFPVVWPPSGVN